MWHYLINEYYFSICGCGLGEPLEDFKAAKISKDELVRKGIDPIFIEIALI